MNKQVNFHIFLLLSIVFISCTGMVHPNPYPTDKASQIKISSKVVHPSKPFQFKEKHKVFKKKLGKRLSIVDEGALLLAVLAVGLAGVVVYYFFTLGFFTGVAAIVIAALLLYLLFQYLEY